MLIREIIDGYCENLNCKNRMTVFVVEWIHLAQEKVQRLPSEHGNKFSCCLIRPMWTDLQLYWHHAVYRTGHLLVLIDFPHSNLMWFWPCIVV